MLVFVHIKCILYLCSKFPGADVFIHLAVLSRKISKVKTILKRLGRVARAKKVNIDCLLTNIDTVSNDWGRRGGKRSIKEFVSTECPC